MGEYWLLMNLDRRQNYTRMGKFGEFFYAPHRSLINHLARVELDYDPSLLTFKPQTTAGFSENKNRDYLALLPVELVDMILKCLKSSLDCMSLAVTSRRYWLSAANEIQRRYITSWPPLRGDRILCVGDNLAAGDIPPGLELDPDILIDLSQKPEEDGSEEDENTDDEEPGLQSAEHSDGDGKNRFTISLYDLACTHFQACPEEPMPDYEAAMGRLQLPLPQPKAPDHAEGETSDAKWERRFAHYAAVTRDIKLYIRLIKRKACVQDHSVLRNLSRSEYVTAEGTRAAGWAPADNMPGLEQVLFARIAWTYEGNFAWEGVGRGVWTGDRFDVVSKEVLNEEAMRTGERWKDVTEEALEDVKRIYILAGECNEK